MVTMIGERFGRLVVVADAPRRGRRQCYECRCDCGAVAVKARADLLRGDTQSCGCLGRERSAERCAARATHGHGATRGGRRQTATYDVWAAMRQRCGNPKNKQYRHYGGRGISVCDRWLHSFENFLSDMGEKPPGKTLDRKDVDGNYEPDNCKWSTPEEQAQNRRDNVLDADRVRELKRALESGARVVEAARIAGVRYATAFSVKRGKSWRNIS